MSTYTLTRKIDVEEGYDLVVAGGGPAGSAAYVLLEHLRRVVLKGTQLAQAQVGTLRVKLLKVAARVRVSVRRVVLHLSSYYPYQPLFTRIVPRLVPI